MGLDNENPTLFDKSEERKVSEKDLDDNEAEEFDSREIFGKLILVIINNTFSLLQKGLLCFFFF